MLFNSLGFLIFFPTVFFLYWMLPHPFRKWLLLGASCYFYMAFVPYYIIFLFSLITVDYVLGRAIGRGSRYRHFYFVLSIVCNIGALFIFKYFNFFNENLSHLASLIHWNYSLSALSIILPLGLSFHIFQSLAYIIEVYKGKYVPEKNYFTYALYVMFFPQLVAGPIERPAQLLPQLSAKQEFRRAEVVAGLYQMLWGFFKKVVIADNLAVVVDTVYGHPLTSGPAVLIAVVAFAFQLYADFSGYSDIAVGSARLLGINLVQNFRQPYFSRSVAEFWRRWHISLSSWFRDYFYSPLLFKGRHLGTVWIYVSIVLTFIATGVWHGAGWKYVVMGLLFGIFISAGQITKRRRDWFAGKIGLHAVPYVRPALQTLTTFMLVSLAWVFFRAQSATQGFAILKTLFTKWGSDSFSSLSCSGCSLGLLGVGREKLLILFFSLAILFVHEMVGAYNLRLPPWLTSRPARWSLYYSLMVWILLFGYFIPKTFIYFQF